MIVCKGDIMLGSGCRKCSRCKEQMERLSNKVKHQFADHDINEIFTGYVSWSTEDILHINYIGPTQSTFYTREDLLHMIDIIDGKEEGVRVIGR